MNIKNWLANAGRGYNATPAQRQEFDAAIAQARPENKAALQEAAATIARADGDKTLSDVEFRGLMNLAQNTASSPLSLDTQIASAATSFAGRMQKHHEAVSTLLRAPELTKLATANSPREYYPAIVDLGSAFLNVDVSLLDESMKGALMGQLMTFQSAFRGAGTVKFPMPGQALYGGNYSESHDERLQAGQAQLFRTCLSALFESVPRKFGLMESPARLDGVDLKKEPREHTITWANFFEGGSYRTTIDHTVAIAHFS